MAALTEARDTREYACGTSRITRVRTIKTDSVIYPGAIVAAESDGKAVPASDTANLTVLGRAESVDGSTVRIRTGVFLYDIGSGSEALTQAEVNHMVYALDDHTVGKTGGTNHLVCGILRDLADEGALVEIGVCALGYTATHTHVMTDVTDIDDLSDIYAALDHTHTTSGE